MFFDLVSIYPPGADLITSYNDLSKFSFHVGNPTSPPRRNYLNVTKSSLTMAPYDQGRCGESPHLVTDGVTIHRILRGTFPMSMLSNHSCSDRPLPTCETSIVVTATTFNVFKANIQRWRPLAAAAKQEARPSAAPHLLWFPIKYCTQNTEDY